MPWTPGGPAGGSAFELAVGAVAGGEPVCCTRWAQCVVVGGEVELAAVAWLGVELVPVVAPWVVVAGVVAAGLAAGAGIEHGVGPMRIAMASSALAATTCIMCGCVAATTCEAKVAAGTVVMGGATVGGRTCCPPFVVAFLEIAWTGALSGAGCC